MQEAVQTTEEILLNESAVLIDKMNCLTGNLPPADISELAIRLKIATVRIKSNLEICLRCDNRIARMKAWIKLSVALKDSRDTLLLIAKYKYANTNSIITMVDNINRMLIFSLHNVY